MFRLISVCGGMCSVCVVECGSECSVCGWNVGAEKGSGRWISVRSAKAITFRQNVPTLHRSTNNVLLPTKQRLHFHNDRASRRQQQARPRVREA